MTNSMKERLFAAGAVVSAVAMLLSGCGANNSNTNSSDNGSNTTASTQEEPAEGIDIANWKGTLPTPDVSKTYNNPQERDNIKDGGTLTLGTTYTANWNSLNTDGNTLYMGTFWQLYMPQLWDYTADGEVSPNPDFLSKVEVTSSDPLVVTYDINPKAKWNDGTDITWKDFESTWKTSNGKDANYTPASTDGYDKIASVKAGTSDKQAVVTFSEPYYPYQALFQNLLNHNSLDAKTYTSGWIDNPHNEWAAGPFKVQSTDKDSTVFVPNEKWWGEKPKLEKITFKYMEDAAALNAFKNGELDSISAGSKDNLAAIKSMKDIQLRLGYSLATYVFTYNTKAGALKDIAVRKAISQAFDNETWNKIAYQGMDWNPERPGSEVFLQFQKGYKNNLPADAQKYSVDAAKKTMEDAGYKLGSDGYYAKDGKTVEVSYVYYGDSSTTKANALAYQAMMKKAGIKVKVDNRATSQWSDDMSKHNYEVMGMGWTATNPFGQTSIVQLYGSDSPSNYAQIGSDEVDKLAAIPGTIEDNDKAVEAGNKAEAAAFELYGTIPTDTPPSYVAVKKGLANYGPAGFQTKHWENIGWQK
ncbi:ABC transporter family substrate-binding protein [Bifidobacterium amazonense]|uniref:ABC transporter family substrate-binding protein n=1 Tax=Bifidobacterium amazonense TaxID=2809027 RepID=A0ABS9VRV0_9BIFI|nr:ABC transporter family substrate-binding protein [Bifidobacterium amazonense]MCH9274823.1 ABC transporter family substrate-binding protein [Bifidobacterium amazonense]